MPDEENNNVSGSDNETPAEALEEHEAEPDEDYVPQWALDLNKKLDSIVEMGKKPTSKKKPVAAAPVTGQRDSNGNPSGDAAPVEANAEVPAPVVAPKAPSFLNRLPKWF